MYTWGDMKNAILAKLDLDEDEALQLQYISRFIIYANEAMTMICSTVKPNRTYYEVEIHDGKDVEVPGELNEETGEFGEPTIEHIPSNLSVWLMMPDDFISFNNEGNWIEESDENASVRRLNNDEFRYIGYNKFIVHTIGKCKISYNARWHMFTLDDDQQVLNVPIDILECIPTYVASQCMKVDDEQKATMFRNEFEMMLARIDNTEYRYTETFDMGGDW